ncbi:MAG: hypothetical protein JJV89_06175 [Desulfosarcina sp.]|nr:hypothetical protein [Desulfobacterales bacterium]
MPVIKYSGLKQYLKETSKKGFEQVYLIFGEEVLYKAVLDKLVKTILPDTSRSLNYEPVEGTNDNIQNVINKLNTYSLLSTAKVVALCDSQIFYTKEDENVILEKAKEACDKNNFKKGAKYFLNLLKLRNIPLEDLSRPGSAKIINLDLAIANQNLWIDKLVDYCLKNKLSATARDDGKILQQAVEKGFPKGNHLIITTEIVNKNRVLYKSINKTGIIIDCSVPKGNRKEDKAAQTAMINNRMKAILKTRGKTIKRDAYNALYAMTGFDLRTFANNLEKLADYTGERNEITLNDVQSVLKRTKKDPLYEFTNATTERNLDQSIFFMSTLLAGDDIKHPLQLLAAIANQMRKLLMIKSFVNSRYGSAWYKGCQYFQFQSAVMPAIIEFDGQIAGRITDWNKILEDDKISEKKRVKKKSPAKTKAVDKIFLIAPNPKNAYPVYMMLKKSDKFTEHELIDIMESIHEADIRFKSTGQAPELILESIIFKICKERV